MTLMFIPHSGRGVKQLHIHRFLFKGLGILVACVVLLSMTMFYHFNNAMKQAKVDKEELVRLQEINNIQGTQIEQLAQATVSLQNDMQRMDKMDEELRKVAGIEQRETTPVSRSGVVRPVVYNPNGGQGGPGPDLQQLVRGVDQIKQQMVEREASMSKMREAIEAKQARMSVTPSVWPCSGQITSPFGWRTSPMGWGRDFHPGIDVANDYGTPISATAAGTVVFAGWAGGYGKLIIIDHGNGIETAYGHNSNILVNVGQKVVKGEQISEMGSTGYSTGPHVHYEVRINGEQVDPAPYMQ